MIPKVIAKILNKNVKNSFYHKKNEYLLAKSFYCKI